MAVPRASVSSASVTPALRAASACWAMQLSHRVVTATASAISSFVLASSVPLPFCPALSAKKPLTIFGLAFISAAPARRPLRQCCFQSLNISQSSVSVAAHGVELVVRAHRGNVGHPVGQTEEGGYGGDVPNVRSEEHTSQLQSLMRISYAVFCLKKKTTN